MNVDINALAAKIYQQNTERGWWDNPDRCIYQTFQLVNTEVAEATEGDRKKLMDDHLPHRTMAEVEMADTFIRLLDLAGRLGLHYEPGHPCHPRLHEMHELGARHLVLTASICQLALGRSTRNYCTTLETLFEICRRENYDLIGAMEEKLEYNRTRADHNRDNRAREHGKRY